MPKLLLTVEDTLEITDLGLLVMPGLLEAEYEGPRKFPVRITSPDGNERIANLELEFVLKTPPPKEPRYGCLFRGLSKADIPIGSFVRTIDDASGAVIEL